MGRAWPRPPWRCRPSSASTLTGGARTGHRDRSAASAGPRSACSCGPAPARWARTTASSWAVLNVRLLLDTTVTELVPERGRDGDRVPPGRGPRGRMLGVQAAIYACRGRHREPRLLLASTRRSRLASGMLTTWSARYLTDDPRGEGLARGRPAGTATNGASTAVPVLGERTSSDYGPRHSSASPSRPSCSGTSTLDQSPCDADLAATIYGSPGSSAPSDSSTAACPGLLHRAHPSRGAQRFRAPPRLARPRRSQVTAPKSPATMFFIDQMEQEPDPASLYHGRSRHARPVSGSRRFSATGRIGPSSYRSQRRMHRLANQLLRAVGVEHFTSEVLEAPDVTPQLWDMKHPSGTTRMSTTPASGVVDPDGLVHGVANLYVTGSSVFPTVGHANPTLTIVALAARLAAHLAARLRVDDTVSPRRRRSQLDDRRERSSERRTTSTMPAPISKIRASTASGEGWKPCSVKSKMPRPCGSGRRRPGSR